MHLVWPSLEYLWSYADALERGWSPNSARPEAKLEELESIQQNPERFLAHQVDVDAKGPPFTQPDGSTVPRLPGYHRWIWDGEFCGSISFRWQPGTEALPPHCLGHIGYGVVPWKRRRGYATRALQALLVEIRGLSYVEITTDVTNEASKRVIEANGGVLIEQFAKLPTHGGGDGLRYRIALRPVA